MVICLASFELPVDIMDYIIFHLELEISPQHLICVPEIY